MEKLEKFLNKYYYLLIVALALPAIWALSVPGFFGASDDLHIGWLYEMDRVLKFGQIPPRFVPDLSFGFGYPLFNFVFPLPFYIAEIFHLMGLSLVDSIKLVFVISLPLSGIFMYLLLKELMASNLIGLAGAILYIYTPYRAVDVYIRGAIGEIVSFVFLPLIVLSFIKLFKSNSWRWIGIGSLTLACLILSHNITAYLFFPFVALLIILQLLTEPQWRRYLTAVLITIFLALLISSYFWIPALWESSLMKYDTIFNFADHFPTLRQLLSNYWGYGASVPGPGDGMSFFLGTLNILVLILSPILIIRSWKKFTKIEKLISGWALIGMMVAIFLMNYRSIFVWNNLPLLPYFQFPWRFLTMTTFFIPLLLISFKYLKFKDLLSTILLFLIISTSWNYFRPEDFLGRQDDYYLNRYIPVPQPSPQYLEIQEEYLRLPKSAERRPGTIYPIIFNGNLKETDVIKINDLHFVVNLNLDKETLVNINKYYFPGWIAKVDGENTDIKTAPPFGQISIMIPAGQHNLEVYFGETTTKKMLDFASLIGFLVSLGMILKLGKFRYD